MSPHMSHTGRGELPAHSDILGTRYVSHHSGLSVWPRTSVVVNGMYVCHCVGPSGHYLAALDSSYVVVLISLHLQTRLTSFPFLVCECLTDESGTSVQTFGFITSTNKGGACDWQCHPLIFRERLLRRQA